MQAVLKSFVLAIVFPIIQITSQIYHFFLLAI